MLLVKKHLGFTKSCQHLKPKTTTFRRQTRPEGCFKVNQKPKANLKEICGESDVVLSVLNVSEQHFVWQ